MKQSGNGNLWIGRDWSLAGRYQFESQPNVLWRGSFRFALPSGRSLTEVPLGEGPVCALELEDGRRLDCSVEEVQQVADQLTYLRLVGAAPISAG